MHDTILCLDIGSGTQDVLLYQTGRPIENCAKFVLPAPARMVGARIAELTAAKKPIYLHGENMGGGFWRSLKPHLQAGLGVAAHPDAAMALGDDMLRLEKMGVAVSENAPEGYAPVRLADYSSSWWQALLQMAGLPLPELILAAAQDHGYHPLSSNRLGRFELWRQFLLEHHGAPEKLLFKTPPEALTRLHCLQKAAGNALVSDTGAAAVLGALCDAEVQKAQATQGATVINLGNSHFIAFLLYKGRILGIYEHHNGMRDADKIIADLERFRKGELSNQEVLDSGGHGCLTLDLPTDSEQGDFARPLFVLGPQRTQLQGTHARFPAPGGDMMLMGCFGLLKGYALQTPGITLPF